jgi:hypothetical protein
VTNTVHPQLASARLHQITVQSKAEHGRHHLSMPVSQSAAISAPTHHKILPQTTQGTQNACKQSLAADSNSELSEQKQY